MITFDEAVQNTIRLHGFFLAHTSPPLQTMTFYTAVNHKGWAVSHMLAGFWKDEKRYPGVIPREDYYMHGCDIVIPSNPAEAFLLGSHRSISVIPVSWNIPVAAFDAFARLPSIPIEERINTLGSALASWIGDNLKTASPELIRSRTSICKACPYWAEKGYLGLGLCRKCGCSGLKVKMHISKCPIGKW